MLLQLVLWEVLELTRLESITALSLELEAHHPPQQVPVTDQRTIITVETLVLQEASVPQLTKPSMYPLNTLLSSRRLRY